MSDRRQDKLLLLLLLLALSHFTRGFINFVSPSEHQWLSADEYTDSGDSVSVA